MRATTIATFAAAASVLAAASAHAQFLPARLPTRTFTPSLVVLGPAPAPTTTAPASTAPAPAPRPGRVICAADENGIPAPASIELRAAGRAVARGSCASPLEVPAGAYDAIVTLESALDRPTRAVRVVVPEGGLATARASFETAILEVRFTSARSPVPGLAIIERDGVVVGTLGSGVTARLSAGTYTVVARYRTAEQRHAVTLVRDQRRALRADF